MARQSAGLSVLLEQLRDTAIGIDAESVASQAQHEADRSACIGEPQAAGREQRDEQVGGVGEHGRAKMEPAGEAQLERHAKQQRVRVGADLAHERQGLAVGADQDVLAVVQRSSIDRDPPRATAQRTRRFQHGDRNAAPGERRGGGQARPAGADDRYALAHVLHAIHSLRTGVSAVRRVSTW